MTGTSPAPGMTMTIQEMLEADEPALTHMFHAFFEETVKGNDNRGRDTAKEMLLLMEGAPELKEKVNKIKIGIQTELEKKFSHLKRQSEECQEEKNRVNHCLLQLNNQYRQALTQKEAKEKEHTLAVQKLELTRKQVKEAETGEKKQWLDQARQWNRQIKEIEINHENAKQCWETQREELNKSFLGVQGAIFQKSPLVAEGSIIQ
jgi:hypothetical protein